MILIWKYLDDAVHQILLGHWIFADHDYFKDLWKHDTFIKIVVQTLEVAKSDYIFTDCNPKFTSLQLALLFILVGI